MLSELQKRRADMDQTNGRAVRLYLALSFCTAPWILSELRGR